MLPKPWYRKSKKAWYLQVGRNEQKCLGKTKAEADTAYRTWLIEEGGSMPQGQQARLTIAEIGQDFLDHSKRHNDPKTYQFYCYFLVPFIERFGAVIAKDLLPRSFTKWLDEHEGWKGTRRNAIGSVKRLFNWAVDEKLLLANPLKHVKKPPKRRRNRVLAPEERAFVFKMVRDQQFREFVFAMLDTGCRPSEVIAVTAKHVSRDGATWIFEEHKTDAEGTARIVYLSPAMQVLTKQLIALYPTGPLFRSARRFGGVRRPWTTNGIRCRFKRLRQKVQLLRAAATPAERLKIPDLSGLTAYVLRHTFCTLALAKGLPVPVVSALLGHKSIKMVDEHYNHMDQATAVLRRAAATASSAGA
ncbi:MAG TPA: site-specific integrase [Gemmataceae bacterium]|nr:site-specific integrase [Gemmataceae bacterium]